ncbi:MAG: YcaO-like family protein [Nannocystaceae bacterium]
MEPSILAPWVVIEDVPEEQGAGYYLLGPGLSLLHMQTGNPHDLRVDGSTRALLQQEGFLAAVERHEVSAGVSAETRDAPTAGPDTGPRCIFAPEASAAARALANALARSEPELPWTVCTSMPEPPPDGTRGTLLSLAHREPVDIGAVVQPLLEHWRVIWCGEGADGTHVGPRLESEADLRDYERATFEWSSMTTVLSLGFSELPLPMARWIRRDASAVAAAVLEVRDRPPGDCIRLTDGAVVRPWTHVVRSPLSSDELLRTQCWSKGMLRDLELERDPSSTRVFFGSCSTPCGADPFLEGNFGKGTSEDEARVTTVGEAVERLGAYLGSLRDWPVAPRGAQADLRLEDFHPFGPGYDEYLRRGCPPLPLTEVWDEVTGQPLAVPRVLVPVPYRPAPQEWVPTGSSSSGLAAYSSRDGAVLRAALEVIERDNLYPSLLGLRPGERLDPQQLPRTGRGGELRAVLDQLPDRGLQWWLVRYPNPEGIPIVHAFVWEESITTMSRGTGSGTTWSSAALKALLEAMQLRLQHQLVAEQGAETDVDPGFVAWARPEVGQQLVSYLDDFPWARGTLPEPANEAELLQRLRTTRPAVLVADLPCPVRGWSVVHVLIPGATCVCVPSNSAGGRPLLDARFEHPIPI